jgi:copper resistance protein D
MFIALLIIARSAHIGATILVAGTFTFKLITLDPVRQPGSDDFRQVERYLLGLAQWSLVAAFLSALFWFWLEVAGMSGLSFAGTLSMTAWQAVLFQTNFGRIWQLRLGLIVVAFALVALGLAQARARRVRVMAAFFVSTVLVASLAWISHAAATEAQPLGVLGDALHLCAASAWIGGLVPMAIFLACVRASASVAATIAPVLRRFSTLSLCCVSLVIVTGISNGWLLVGSFHALFTTSYGWLLLFKLTLFVVLVGFGARNRFVIKRKSLKSSVSSHLLLCLRRNVIWEACLSAVVVTIVACLGVTPPARHP